ncbi:uncharacterized protein BYT42DRAFT_496134 [Radiomyces spectabilis]|uniref:uncharacterized protein n=1 Tax=Radiomyces spectabilis TaxID=64574 RepID=UPI002220508A|nr:uncharacterized protein BYT42DRAFT_496134 [Radiomyces spectabilis]KAI8379656.1 hypothetical protein BYT42DRAFT_496134 [Radiomyces spectabilis]
MSNHPQEKNQGELNKGNEKTFKDTLPPHSNEPRKSQDYNEWDLYPGKIRQVENQGTPEQVKHLHELEHTPPQKQQQQQ